MRHKLTERFAPVHFSRCLGLQSLRHELSPLFPVSSLDVVVVDLDCRGKLGLRIGTGFNACTQMWTYQGFLLPRSECTDDEVGLLLLDERIRLWSIVSGDNTIIRGSQTYQWLQTDVHIALPPFVERSRDSHELEFFLPFLQLQPAMSRFPRCRQPTDEELAHVV